MGHRQVSGETQFRQTGDMLSVRGEIDVSVVDLFNRSLTSLVESNPGSTVWVDMGGVSFIDSSGLGALVGAQKQASETGGSVMLRNLQDSQYKVFEITGLRAMFGIV